MTITLTARLKVALLNSCSKLLQKSRQKIWVVSTVIGMIIAALPGVKHRALQYHTLESQKTAALCHNGNDYNGNVTIPPLATMEIQWRHTNISTSRHFIHAPPPDTTIYSNASLDGWDATNSLTIVGIWTWAISHNIWLSAAYILGDTNVVAGFHSRCFTENNEWALNTGVFLICPNIFSNLRLTYSPLPSFIRFPCMFPGYLIQMRMHLMILLFH